ncbi:transcriptional regulator, TetR family [Ruegeria halocynthiae]|uniref:Transcriptional regulator, TetR family n=1 Tax=Ruegeria halocynthiae TaxID=985054 RepID=A0A1H3ED70_9RHOB|nr:TetR/AcrR family transcriptional regulator [Ruegeria halocynthiae]SDX76560.1 transcriptional regulator, TetR family [Ruegeria halocynthiae]
MKTTKRKNMPPKERRDQLLGCAQILFFSKGFEDTTVQDVLDLAGVSKGGFYHHFKSKDELLFGVLDGMAEGVFSQMDLVASDETSSALKLLRSFTHLRANYLREHDYPGQVEFFRVMNQDKNLVLLEQFKRRVRTGAMPVLTRIIQKGRDDGTFNVADVDTAAELILFLSTFMDLALLRAIEARGTDTADHAARNLQAAIDMQFQTIDRILGLPDGTTDFGWPEAVDVTMATEPPPPPSIN